MTFRKRLRVILAALRQQWHVKQCAECGFQWFSEGKDTNLLQSCDDCRIEDFERFVQHMEQEYQRQARGAL